MSLLLEMSFAPWSSSFACDTRRHESPQLRVLVATAGKMFWHLLLGLVIGGQECRVLPISTVEWEEKNAHLVEQTGRIWPNVELSARVKFTRENFVKQFWSSFVEDKFDMDTAIKKT